MIVRYTIGSNDHSFIVCCFSNSYSIVFRHNPTFQLSASFKTDSRHIPLIHVAQYGDDDEHCPVDSASRNHNLPNNCTSASTETAIAAWTSYRRSLRHLQVRQATSYLRTLRRRVQSYDVPSAKRVPMFRQTSEAHATRSHVANRIKVIRRSVIIVGINRL